MKSCIIIGNGSSILNKNLGEYVDSFDNVVRFNRFQVENYKQDLGTKCTHWVVGYNLATDNMSVNNGYFKGNLDRLQSTHPELEEILILTSKATKNKNLNEIKKLKQYVKLNLVYKEYDLFFNAKPTTGFMTIKYFLNKFDKISIAGFDFGKSHHYWGNYSIADVPAPEGKHPWKSEGEYVDKLVKSNKIEML
jgi:hypothetical protein